MSSNWTEIKVWRSIADVNKGCSSLKHHNRSSTKDRTGIAGLALLTTPVRAWKFARWPHAPDTPVADVNPRHGSAIRAQKQALRIRFRNRSQSPNWRRIRTSSVIKLGAAFRRWLARLVRRDTHPRRGCNAERGGVVFSQALISENTVGSEADFTSARQVCCHTDPPHANGVTNARVVCPCSTTRQHVRYSDDLCLQTLLADGSEFDTGERGEHNAKAGNETV